MKDQMIEEIAVLSPDDNVFEAATLMKDHGIHVIPIILDGIVIGTITDRDIVTRGVAEKRPNSVEVREVMSQDYPYGHKEMSLEEARNKMIDSHVYELIILEDQRCIGRLSLEDSNK